MAEKKKKSYYEHIIGLLDRAADPLGKPKEEKEDKSKERSEAERREQMRRLPKNSPARIAYEKNQAKKKRYGGYSDTNVKTGKVKHY